MIIANKRTARIFKAFSDENRLMILKMLQKGERCACNLLVELNITQSTLSHHMGILCDAEVVNARKEGKWTHYSLNEEGCMRAVLLLAKLLDPDFAQNRECCDLAWEIASKALNRSKRQVSETESDCC